MANQLVNLPVFPIALFLLPQGVNRLRVFEAKYLKLVSLALNNGGFILWDKEQAQVGYEYGWGSLVEIINFNQGQDGILEVDIKCKSLVKINKLDKSAHELLMAEAEPLSHWSEKEAGKTKQYAPAKLTDLLYRVLNNENQLNRLYQSQKKKNANWVVARWLEILPITFETKSVFISTNSLDSAQTFVEKILLK